MPHGVLEPFHLIAERREALAEMLGGTGILDLLAIDGSQVSLPASAMAVLPSTSDQHGGFKLTATLSLLFQKIQRVDITNARMHDRKALKLARWLHGLLLVLDRGYSDHSLFKTIDDRGGFFLTRLKESSVPVVTAIRSGLGRAHVGKELTGELPYRGVVDLDARFRLRRGGSKVFRVIRVVVEQDTRDGHVKDVDIWFVTNLAPTVFTAEQVATIYRMRWEVEILFRALNGQQAPALYALASHNSHFARVARALNLIQKDYGTNLDVERLAEQAHMSTSAFHRAFKEVTSDSPLQYLKKIRLSKARDFMVQEGMKAYVAADMVGYESASQFSREFKRYFGQSPAEIIREVRTA